ncbi:serine hydrolase domain-containing protein [Agromyces sp. SYSU T00266]|uniref:serine hydrolase domain-containing protein n=1 Tax=Agromyces zhanjiangensis TaxID=3158562 RepID=UPI0033936025
MNLESPIRDAVDRAIGDGLVEAAAIRVSTGNGLIANWARGETGGVAVTEDSVWWLASLTKPVVAMALLACVDDSMVSLDDRVADLVSGFPALPLVRRVRAGAAVVPAPPFSAEDPNEWIVERGHTPLTLRHLVTGTSGLQTLFVPNAAVPPVIPGSTLAGFVDAVAAAPLDFEPGTRWHYSNTTAFEVIARIIEVVSGRDVRTLVRERILEPIGASTASFGISDAHAARTLPVPPFLVGHPMVDGSFPSGSAGMFATAEDVERVVKLLLSGEGEDGVRVLPEDLVAGATSNQIGELRLGGLTPELYGGLHDRRDPRFAFGYGVITVQGTTEQGIPVGSFGWDGIGTRRFWGIPSRGVALVMLVEGAGAAALHRQIEGIVMASTS